MRQELPTPSLPRDPFGFRQAAKPRDIARQPKRHLGLDERLAVFRLARDRGTPVELIAAAFGCSVGTVLKIANLAVSEVTELSAAVQTIKPTTDGEAVR